MERVDYVNTFIAVAPDCAVDTGTVPPTGDSPSVAARSYGLIAERPYGVTSGDVIFTVFADRSGIAAADRDVARAQFYARPRACLRSSDLGKRYGWGIHADTEGRLALYGVESQAYARLAAGTDPDGRPVKVLRAMRSTRATGR